MKPIHVADIMTREVVALEIDHSVNLATGVMSWRHIRHLPVVQHGVLVGLVTHRDLAAAQAQLLARPAEEALREDALSVPVLQIMRRNVWTVFPETPVLEAARIMIDHRFGCLPVVNDEGRLVGIVTEVDLLQLLVRKLAALREIEDTDPVRPPG